MFTPLDMADGVADTWDAERMPPGHEYYFGTVRTAERTFDTSGHAYGYLAGSATDLAHLVIPLLNHDTQFLTTGTAAGLQHGGSRAAGGRYSLGWRTTTLTSAVTPVVWHAGAVTGYHTTLITAPEAGWAIAVQQNVYSPLHDEALNSAAFGALTIGPGGTPAPIPGTATETIVPVMLGVLVLVLVLVLAGALAWTFLRLLARRLGRRPGWRAVLATAGWAGLGILPATTGGLLLPGMLDLQLRHIVRFMPDMGQLAIAIIVLGPALALARLATLIAELIATDRHGDRRAGSNRNHPGPARTIHSEQPASGHRRAATNPTAGRRPLSVHLHVRSGKYSYGILANRLAER